METETFRVLTSEGDHEYNIIVTKDTVIRFDIFASNNDCWREETKGTLFFTITDTGDNISFDKKIKKLEYDDVLLVRILLNFINYYDTANGMVEGNYKIVEETILAQL